MAAGEAIGRRAVLGRAAFNHYLRTGRVPAFPEDVETKFNHNHDPSNGRFTSGPGGAARGLRAAAQAPGAERNRVVQLKPLNATDRVTYAKIAATPPVKRAMDEAWAQSDKDGHERGFFIYQDGERFYAGKTITGTEDELPGLYETFQRVDALKGQFGHVVAWYHTHPGNYSTVSEADTHDRNFNNGLPVPGVFMIIRSHHDTIKVGR